jgi:sec-independent protein translocase protein TatC
MLKWLIGGKKAASTDGEMSFVDHLEELRGTLLRCLLAVVACSIIFAFYTERIVNDVLLGPIHTNFITYKVLCDLSQKMGMGNYLCTPSIPVSLQNTQVGGNLALFFQVIFFGGIVFAFPFIFWQLWRFIKPALKQKEVKGTRGVIFWVSLLFFIGIAFGYFVLAPFSISFMANFTVSTLIKNDWDVGSYLDTFLSLILSTGVAFQLPLAIYFLNKLGVIGSGFLRKQRRYAIVIILIVAAIITPPDIISQMIVFIPLYALFEISIWVAVRSEAKEKKKELATWE